MMLVVWPFVIALVSGLSLWKCYLVVYDHMTKTPRSNSITLESLPVCRSPLTYTLLGAWPGLGSSLVQLRSHEAELSPSCWERWGPPWLCSGPALKLQLSPLVSPEPDGRYPWASCLPIPDPDHHPWADTPALLQPIPVPMSLPSHPGAVKPALALLCPPCLGTVGPVPTLVRSLPCWQCCRTWLLAHLPCRSLISTLTSIQNFNSSHFLLRLILPNIPWTICIAQTCVKYSLDNLSDPASCGTTCWHAKSCYMSFFLDSLMWLLQMPMSQEPLCSVEQEKTCGIVGDKFSMYEGGMK